MKRIVTVLLVWGIVAVASAGGLGFWAQLTPEERKAAGVDQLTPEQQAALDRAAGRFARQEAEPVREQAQREAREETARQLNAEQKARDTAKAGLPDEDVSEVVRCRIAGPFNGWSERTQFQLDNGQVWKQANPSDRLWIPTVQNPEIEIRRTAFGWKLRLVERGSWLYVRRVK